MATFRITGPDGSTYEVNAPDDATEQQVLQYVQANAPSAPTQAKERTGSLAALAEGAAQGLTFGFSDEIEGAGRALFGKVTGDERSLSDLYSEGVAKPRERIKTAADTNPIAYYTGEVGSAVAVPGGLARVGVRGALANSAGKSLGARSVAAAKEGSAYGAAYATGKSEGDGLGEIALDTAKGAGTGAALGLAVPGAVDAVSAVGRRVAAPFKAYANPKGHAAEKFGEAVARDSGGAPNATQRFSDRFDDMAAANPSVVAMDAGGENVRGLMRAANNMPNEAREGARRLVDARQGSQHVRLADDIEAAIQSGSATPTARGYFQSIDDQVDKMEKAGEKLIKPYLAKETPMTPALKNVLERPTMKELHGLIGRKLADENKPIGLMTRTEMIHRMKMELDEQMGVALQAKKMGNKPAAGWDYNTLKVLKRDLLNAVDNPGYKTGLKVYAGEAQLKNAAEEGFEGYRSMAPEEISKKLKELSTEAERQMFRAGAARAILTDIRRPAANRDRTSSVFASPETMMKLKALFPSQKQYREFQGQLVIENKMAKSRSALQGNSTTAKQLAEGSEAGKEAGFISSVINAASGKLAPMLDLAARGYNRFSGLSPPVAAEIMRHGMSRDPRMADPLVQSAIRRAMEVPAHRAAVSEAGIAGLNAPMLEDMFAR
jgi:hypothetical protein